MRPVIAGACTWEAVAITTGHRGIPVPRRGRIVVPTWSAVVRRTSAYPAGRLALALLLGWLGVHLAEKEVVRAVEEALDG